MEPSINKDEPTSNSSNSEMNEVKHLTDRLNLAQSKLKKLSRLEAAILDMCLEINDRMKPNDSGREESIRHHRREVLLQKAEGDVLSLLNSLRTQLRIHWSLQGQKDEYIDETVSSMTLRQEATQSQLQEQLAQSQADCQANQDRIETLLDQISTQEHEKTLLMQHTQRHVQALTQELESCQRKITEQAQEIQRLSMVAAAVTTAAATATAATAQNHGSISAGSNNSGGMPMASGKSLAASASTSALGGNGGLAALEMLQAKRQLKEYELKLCKMEAQQEEMKAEIQKYQQQLTGFRHSSQTLTIAKLERENKRFKEKCEEIKRKFDQEEADNLRTRGILKEKEQLIQNMKEEYHKLFLLVQKQKQQHQNPKLSRTGSLGALPSCFNNNKRNSLAADPSVMENGAGSGGSVVEGSEAGAGSNTTTAMLANENPYLLDLYKSKIDQLEKQLEHMKLQIRKMIAVEYIQKQKNRLFKEEKHKYLETIDTLKKELEKQVFNSAKAMTNHQLQLQQQQKLMLLEQQQQSRKKNGLVARNASTLEDIKQLKKRNEYLENRLREILNGSIRDEMLQAGDDEEVDDDHEEEEEEEEDALEVLRQAQEAYDQENQEDGRQRSKSSLTSATSVSISTQNIGIKLSRSDSNNNIPPLPTTRERSLCSTSGPSGPSGPTGQGGSTGSSSNSNNNNNNSSSSKGSGSSIDGELMRQMKARPKSAFVLSSHLRPKDIGSTKSTVVAKSLL